MPRRGRRDDDAPLAAGAPAEGAATPPEFSRPLRTAKLPPDGADAADKATEAERAALALRYDVAELRRMSFEARIRPMGDGWRVTGTARARVVQACVVTLEPVVQPIEERFDRRLQPGVPAPDLSDLDPDEEADPPEPLGEWIDPAEMAAEAVALAIDPYPRAGGVDFDGVGASPPGTRPPEREKPFAGLAALRARLAPDGDDPTTREGLGAGPVDASGPDPDDPAGDDADTPAKDPAKDPDKPG
ncbi:MAG: DUF177 domain-containing protein [Pseudomonadota bacterium]